MVDIFHPIQDFQTKWNIPWIVYVTEELKKTMLALRTKIILVAGREQIITW